MSDKIVKIITDWPDDKERVDTITGEVSYERVKHVISNLKRALYDNPDVPALCAPQIGEELRLFVVRNSRKEDNRFTVFLNPMIIQGEGLHMSREANPCFPGKEFIIPRKDKIHVAFQQEDGQVDSKTFVGAYGEVVQQMVEMLDGVTLKNYGLDLDDVGGPKAFDRAKKDEKAEVIQMYLETLKSMDVSYKEEIENDPELKAIDDRIRFQKEVLLGNIKPIDENGRIVDEEYIKELAKKKAEDVVKKMEDAAKEVKE